MSARDLLASAEVQYEWRIPEQMPVEQMESGRRLVVAPNRVIVIASRDYREGLSVYLHGPRINRDGSRGGQKSVSFHNGNAYFGQDMARLPGWARPYLDAAQVAESATIGFE